VTASYVEQLDTALREGHPVESAETRAKRVERRTQIELEIQRIQEELDPISQALKDEQQTLASLEQDQAAKLLVAPRVELESIENSIRVSTKTIDALTVQHQELGQTLHQLNTQRAKIDAAIKEAEEDDRISELIHRISADYFKATDVDTGIRFQRIHRLYREVVDASCRKLTEYNRGRLQRQANLLEQHYKTAIVQGVLARIPHNLQDRAWEYF